MSDKHRRNSRRTLREFEEMLLARTKRSAKARILLPAGIAALVGMASIGAVLSPESANAAISNPTKVAIDATLGKSATRGFTTGAFGLTGLTNGESAKNTHNINPANLEQITYTLKMGGKTRTLMHAAGTWNQLLKDAGVTLSPNDVANVNLLAPATSGTEVVITQVKRVLEQKREPIAFNTVKKPDPNLDFGKEEVKEPGKEGSRLITYAVTSKDGHEDTRIQIAQVDQAPVDKVIMVGTKGAPDTAVMAAGNLEATMPVYSGNPAGNMAIGLEMSSARGWGGSQFNCLVQLWSHESGWNHLSMNRGSGAYGIPQALPGSKMASAGADWKTNPRTQIAWGLGYISGRYGTPCGALNHWQTKHWY